MKKAKKLLVILSFVLSFSVFCGINQVAASENQNYTMNDVKKILDQYLEQYHPDIVFGSNEYIEYLTEQLVEQSDANLMSNPNAELILDYASIYLSESDNDNPQFMSKTIGEIENEIANDENKITLMPTPRSSIGAVPAYRDNINAATAYARLWAEDYNPAYKRQSNGDCCNFVSQILTAGKLYGTLPS